MAKWIGINDLAKFTEGVMSAPGIKKAAQTNRIPAKKSGRVWLVDADSEVARNWIAEAKAKAEPSDVESLRAEVERLNRENAQLAKRTRQAEASERRARRELEKVRLESAEQTQQNLNRIYQLSEQVATSASTQTENMARALVQALTQAAPQVIEGATVSHDADGRE